MKYEDERIYLSFQTTRRISEILKAVAKAEGISQPKYIEKIVTDYIKELDEIAKQILEEEGIQIY